MRRVLRGLGGLVAVFRSRKSGMPTVKDFIRMGPERTAAWHRQSGIEARVVAAIAEAEAD